MPDPIPTPDVDPIVATPSAENGTLPLETEPVAPSAEPTPEPVTPTEPIGEPELFELPDGRKVDAGTLSKEWKENFYPDYTRKSQALAAKDTTITTEPTKDPLEDWQPQSYAEIVQKAKDEMKADLVREQQQAQEKMTAIETAVGDQLTAVKTVDPTVNENALFQHALKYKFSDLRVAHQNMKDMSEMAKAVQQKTVRDVTKRSDPVSVTPGATGGKPNPGSFSSATEYLRSLKDN